MDQAVQPAPGAGRRAAAGERIVAEVPLERGEKRLCVARLDQHQPPVDPVGLGPGAGLGAVVAGELGLGCAQMRGEHLRLGQNLLQRGMGEPRRERIRRIRRGIGPEHAENPADAAAHARLDPAHGAAHVAEVRQHLSGQRGRVVEPREVVRARHRRRRLGLVERAIGRRRAAVERPIPPPSQEPRQPDPLGQVLVAIPAVEPPLGLGLDIVPDRKQPGSQKWHAGTL